MEKMVLELRTKQTQGDRFAGELAAEVKQDIRKLQERVRDLEQHALRREDLP